jgi:hypothetical protein
MYEAQEVFDYFGVTGNDSATKNIKFGISVKFHVE